MVLKKTLLTAVMMLVLLLLLAGCGCEHEWVEADCVTPKTCSLCGETEGAPLGHTWAAADCTTAKTCEVCDETEGEALGHTWEDATCVLPKKCATCHETEGEALSHEWEEATTEAPKTCVNCQATEGSKLNTDPRFTTASTKELYGKWSCEVTVSGEMMGTTGYLDELECTYYYEFGKTGEVYYSVELHDYFAYIDALKAFTVDETYRMLEEEGYSKAESDAAFEEYYGMSIQEYVDATYDGISQEDILESLSSEGVYYVGQNGIYFSDSWYGEFESSAYTLEDGVLIIEEDVLEEGGEPMQWTKVEEE